MGTTFDNLLASLHGGSGANLLDKNELGDNNLAIVIDAKRQFIVPDGYNLVLAYEGDINSQIVTFKIPAAHEGHNLGACGLKTLRWRNTSSNVEDWSNLEVIDTNATTVTLKWIVPPAAFATAGNIEIAISIYDLVVVGGKNQIAFSWNTPTYSGFSVGGTLSNVGEGPNIPQIIAPAKNEILFIHEETQSIVAPAGYNFNITTYGNKNTDFLYFQTTKTIGGIDLSDSDEDARIYIIVSMGEFSGNYLIPSQDIVTSFADGSEGSGLLSFIWKIPEEITYNAANYTGVFSIAVSFKRFEEEEVNGTAVSVEKESWTTATFHNLTIRRSLIYNAAQMLPDEFCNIIDGNSENLDLTPRAIPGLVRFREATSEDIDEELETPPDPDKQINKNEIVVVYEEGQIMDLAIGNSNGTMRSSVTTITDIVKNFLENAEVIIDATNIPMPTTEQEGE